MKKIILLLGFIFMLTNIRVFASDIEIQPTMHSKSNIQNRLWVCSFQLAWNDLINKAVHNPIKFKEGTPTSVIDLNQQSFTTNDISEKIYYKYAGKVKKNTKKKIAKNVRKKFRISSDLLEQMDLTPRNDMFFIYAILCKEFEFINAFDNLGHSLFGLNTVVEYYGINEDSDKRLNDGVKVLFYNAPDDYAVKLITTGEDEVYLYKNSSNKPFNSIYEEMIKKTNSFEGSTDLRKIDEFKFPKLSLYEEKIYKDLAGRRIKGTNLVIDQAMQIVKFSMDNKGAKLKGEAGLTAEVTSLLPPEELVPRHFYFDGTFVLFLQEKEKQKPYFALRIDDIELFQDNK